MREKAHAPDRMFLTLAGMLVAAGVIILASASVGIAQHEHGHPLYYVIRQLSFGAALGVLAALFVQIVPLSLIRSFAPTIFFATIVLLIVVLIPDVGIGAKGAMRWIPVGPLTVQPSEIAKVAVPLYLAAWLTARFHRRDAEKNEMSSSLTPFLVIIGAFGLPLILQPDISTFGVIAITALVMYFLSGGSIKMVTSMIAMGLLSLMVLIQVAPYRANRITAFLHPEYDPLGVGYQINHALLAVGSGGVFGRGLGFSREKLFFLPEPMGDSIFAVFAEEAGFFGAALLIGLFIVFLWRGYYIAKRLPDPFMQLFAAGLITWISVQTLMNIAGNLALLPLLGITLPFISYGSASLAVTLLSVGLILKMSRYMRE